MSNGAYTTTPGGNTILYAIPTPNNPATQDVYYQIGAYNATNPFGFFTLPTTWQPTDVDNAITALQAAELAAQEAAILAGVTAEFQDFLTILCAIEGISPSDSSAILTALSNLPTATATTTSTTSAAGTGTTATSAASAVPDIVNDFATTLAANCASDSVNTASASAVLQEAGTVTIPAVASGSS